MPRLPPRVGIETLLVGVAALAFALVANAVSPRGLALSQPRENSAVLETAADLLRVERDTPRGGLVVVDAQGEFGYRTGHIPGALRLDLSHVEATLGPILARASHAQAVVVYCKSSDCANSLAAANLLQQAHVPANGHLLLYRGGIRDWVGQHHPVKEGDAP